MRRAALLLGVTVVVTLAASGVARADDYAVTCRPTADDLIVGGGAVGGWGRISCTGSAYWALEACVQKWVRPDDEFYEVGNCGRQSDVSSSGEIPGSVPCSYAGYGEFRLWVHIAWYANGGWHDAYTTSSVAWACWD
jgi:hypothetical protein